MDTLGLYIHIPFCLRKCHYCDFVSYPNMQGDIDDYIDALLAEAKLYESHLTTHEIDTVFIGGGTPSLLSAAQIDKLAAGLRRISNFNPSEFTIESNPESLTERKIIAYKNAGINRLSIGLQSHDDDILRAIGRGHTNQDFIKAYNIAQKHLSNINVDTIFGLPGQTADNFRETIQSLITLSPAHISSYALKLEQGTKLYSTFFGVDDETDRQMYHSAIDLLTRAGYRLYETSNFSKPNMECKHNLKYWTGKSYLGLGVAAHSYLNGNERVSNTEDIKQYNKMLAEGIKPVENTTVLNEDDLLEEYIMLRLRLAQGIEFSDFNRKFNYNFKERYADEISIALSAGLITLDDTSMHPTVKGFDLQNTLITQFMKKM